MRRWNDLYCLVVSQGLLFTQNANMFLNSAKLLKSKFWNHDWTGANSSWKISSLLYKPGNCLPESFAECYGQNSVNCQHGVVSVGSITKTSGNKKGKEQNVWLQWFPDNGIMTYAVVQYTGFHCTEKWTFQGKRACFATAETISWVSSSKMCAIFKIPLEILCSKQLDIIVFEGAVAQMHDSNELPDSTWRSNCNREPESWFSRTSWRMIRLNTVLIWMNVFAAALNAQVS